MIRALGCWALFLVILAPLGCDEGDRRSQLLAGCKSDKDCENEMVCVNTRCTHKKPEAAKPAPKPAEPAAPKANHGDLKLRLCPGYWGKSQNTGSIIATELATGKKRYQRLNKIVEDGDFEDDFVYEQVPYGDYEVKLYVGVIANRQKDISPIPCAEKMPCKGSATRLITVGPEPSEEEWEAQLKQWQKEKYPGTDKDDEVLRRPCDFDVDYDPSKPAPKKK